MRAILFKHGQESFLRALREAGVPYSNAPTPHGPMASGVSIHIGDVSAIAGSLATVLVAWIKARASRSVQVTVGDRTIHVQGISMQELEELLPKATSATIIDTKPDREGP